MDYAEYRALDATAMAELVNKGSVSPAELLAAARARAHEVNPHINAIVAWHDDEPTGDHPSSPGAPFRGVPFLVKDLYQSQAGRQDSAGCRAFAGRTAEHTETVVERWQDAGLVTFGRTNTPEFGAKGVTESRLHGPARNPWSLGHSPGGSSGGSAAAVAAGVVAVAGANDGGGSIRIPAACCGLFGLKPGRGVVPAGPAVGEMFHGGAVHGVISRTVRDTARMLDVLARPDPAAPYAVARPEQAYVTQALHPPRRLRIGVQTSTGLNAHPHPEALAAADDAVRLLEQLGHEVEPVRVEIDDRALAHDFLIPWFVHVASEVQAARQVSRRRRDVELDSRVLAAVGEVQKATAYVARVERWNTYTRALSDVHRRYDLLLTPTLATPPPAIGAFETPWHERILAELGLALHAGRLMARLGLVEDAVFRSLAWVPYTQLANLTGRPAATVPLHWTADGLPLGVQFVAAPGGEGLLLSLAAQLELARPWADRQPPMLPVPSTHRLSGR